MFFTSKVNYKATPTIMAYASVQKVYKLQQQTPPTVKDANLVKFVNPIWNATAIQVNFQEQIDKQKVNLITPEKVEKLGLQIDPNNVVYQSVPLSNFNATDLRDASKVITQSYINQQAKQLAANDINAMKQQQTLDAKITNLKTQLNILQQQKQQQGEK